MKSNGKWLAVVLVVVILLGVLVIICFNIPRNTVRVACAGDSITDGTEYPHDLALLLGTNYSVGNFGVGGSTVSLQSDKPYMNQTKFQSLKDFSPNIIIIMLGTNDAYPSRQQGLDSFKSDYEKLIASFQTLSTKPKIYILLPPPIFNDSLGPNNKILAQNVIPLIRQVANETGLSVVDTNTPLLGRAYDFWDGVHPNSEGAKILATQICNAIR